jgi:hypothetical protein
MRVGKAAEEENLLAVSKFVVERVWVVVAATGVCKGEIAEEEDCLVGIDLGKVG